VRDYAASSRASSSLVLDPLAPIEEDDAALSRASHSGRGPNALDKDRFKLSQEARDLLRNGDEVTAIAQFAQRASYGQPMPPKFFVAMYVNLVKKYERYRVTPTTMDEVMGRLPWETVDALMDESFIRAQRVLVRNAFRRAVLEARRLNALEKAEAEIISSRNRLLKSDTLLDRYLGINTLPQDEETDFLREEGADAIEAEIDAAVLSARELAPRPRLQIDRPPCPDSARSG
jgi:hypothetical protein